MDERPKRLGSRAADTGKKAPGLIKKIGDAVRTRGPSGVWNFIGKSFEVDVVYQGMVPGGARRI